MAWQDAVEPDGDGCALLLEVTPGAKRNAFPSGFNDWRGRLEMRVHGQPQEGRANQDVIAEIARFFQIPPRRVLIEAGGADRRKRVALVGVTREEAIARLTTAAGDMA